MTHKPIINQYLKIFVPIIFLLTYLNVNSQEFFEKEIEGNTIPIDKNQNNLLAKIGNKEIYLDEFIRRAEYTIRPPYCNGSSVMEKMIVLNSLIAEKLLVLESDKKSGIYKSETFLRYIKGRKEQAMRQILFLDVAYKEAEVDTAEVLKRIELAERIYNLKFLNIDNKEIADSAIKIFRDTNYTFENTLGYLTGQSEIPSKQVEYFSKELPVIHDSLYSRKLKIGEIIGPVSIDDTTNLILKIDGWTVRKNLSPEANKQIYADLEEEIRNDKADGIYKDFMSEVMKGKTINFNSETFIPLVNSLGPLYIGQSNKMKELFLHQKFEKEIEFDDLDQYDDNIEKLIDEPLFEIDGIIYTVGEFEKYLDIHPLVFRKKKMKSNEFAEQLKLAIVDAIRDKYITDVAYQKGFDKDPRVIQYSQMFEDAVVSLYEKNKLLSKKDNADLNQLQIIEKYLNPYFNELQKKYSDEIFINVELFNSIELTSTNLFVTQKGAPFPITVPAFPLLITDHHLDYGQKLYEK